MTTNNKKNKQKAYIEIRPAAGGDEAKLWASDLLRMYVKYAGKKGWKVKPVDMDTVLVYGKGAFDLLKHETGVHRVQRVPETERRGRIHTSTATVAVLPEIKASQVKIRSEDIDIQFYRSSGSGGQNVNKVSTAVRVIHKPTGTSASSQQERTQVKNRQIAMNILRSKLWEKQQEKKEKKVKGYRKGIGRGMRAEKIRTYNYPQNRVKDHRIGKSWQNLSNIIDGDLDKVLKTLKKKIN